MARRKHDLTDREMLTFVHNAQLALVDRATDEEIPILYSYQEQLLESFQESSLEPQTIATILVGAAWKLLNGGGVNGGNRS